MNDSKKQWVLDNPDKVRSYKRKYCERNKEKVNKAKKEWRLKNPDYYKQYLKGYDKKRKFYPERIVYMKDYHRNWHYKKKYGLSFEDIQKIWEKCQGICEICRVKTIFKDRKSNGFALDHKHNTKKIRGVLCQRCNLGIGLFKDSIKFLESAKKYLQKKPM